MKNALILIAFSITFATFLLTTLNAFEANDGTSNF